MFIFTILNLCREEISHGEKVGDKFEEYSTKLNDDLYSIRKNRENKEDHNIEDQKILEDKSNKNSKYKQLEEYKFNELKKKIDSKISDVYAYVNRKEFKEYVNNREKDEEYEMYYRDIRKINNSLELKRVKEKEKLVEIENLLEDATQKKNYLKSIIEKFRILNENQKEKSKKISNVNNGDFFIFYNKKKILKKINKNRLHESTKKVRGGSPYSRDNNIGKKIKIKRLVSPEKICGKNSMAKILKDLNI